MTHMPEIQWLIDRWGLPADEASVACVRGLLDAERHGGNTAVAISGGMHWGHAAAPPEQAGDAPLVLLEGGTYLQSRRCHLAERSVAQGIMRLAAPGHDDELRALKEDGTDAVAPLFPGANADDRQIAAARTALRRKLTIITGGPGTGKTYVLARILALLVAGGLRSDFIRLAAPTGKAADRMRGAVEDALAAMQGLSGRDREALHRIAARNSTLHALLGHNPSRARCRYNASAPLPCDVLIVDECSMVDLFLWKAMLEALPDHARLILLGDPLQLQSVGLGNVFGALVAHADNEDSALRGALVRLTDSRRFKDRPGIRRLAETLEDGDATGAEKLLRGAENSPEDGLAWIESDAAMMPYKKLPDPIRAAIETVARADSPRDALEALGKVCILAAHRRHFLGAEAVGKTIARELAARHAGPAGRPPNEPIIIAVNDPETGLRNGSVGIIHTDDQGNRRAWFPHGDGLRPHHPGALPEYAPAWAITIHRSQGSEYDNVLVLLPHDESPLATRELLYTAITRAKRNVIIAGSMAAVRAAVTRPENRVALIKQALDAAAAESEQRGLA